MMSKVILDLGYYSVYGVNLLCRDNEINMTQCQKFSCQQCNKSFGRNDSLKEHSLIHTGEKLHKCHSVTSHLFGVSV